MTNITFEYEGKRYTALWPTTYARLPDGTLLKVKSTGDDGIAEVTVSSKKSPTADETSAAEEVVDIPAAFQVAQTTPDLATLKKEWEECHEQITQVETRQAIIATDLAAALVKRDEGKKVKSTVRLAGIVYKVQRAKDGVAPPKLVKVPELGPEAA